MDEVYPGEEWECADPVEAGVAADGLEETREWLAERAGETPYRAVIVRGGRLVAEWQQGIGTHDRPDLASAAKSVYSCMLGIAVAEGKVGSAADKVVDYYPQMMDVPEGKGPKPGRFAKPEDRDITFRQLIGNTSGYMKPGETPGSTFHYQTFGMNVLCHAIASAYGRYDSADPEGSPGLGSLIEERIRDPIGGSWEHGYTNFDLPAESLLGIFGYYNQLYASARDMARLGLLWLRGGRWGDAQVAPEDWLAEAVRTAPDIRANCPEDEWCYGYGFWTNDHGKLWPALPRDSFAANGAGRRHIWVCPSLDLIVTQSPGLYETQSDEVNRQLLERLTAACT